MALVPLGHTAVFGLLALGSEDPKRYRKVERRPLLPEVRRSQVHYYLLRGELVAAVGDGHPYPLPRLLHRRIRQTHDRETRQARAHINLYLHRQSLYPE